MQSINEHHPLRRHFAALVEHAFFTEVGVCDPSLTDYLSDLLVEFTHMDRLNAIRNAQGRKLEHLAQMLVVLSTQQPTNRVDRDRELYRQIGDYSLFWAGMFPEHLRRASAVPSDALLDFVKQGKRSYAIVSDLAPEDYVPPPSLFRHLSEDFERCLYGLGLVRREWEHADPGGTSTGPLIV